MPSVLTKPKPIDEELIEKNDAPSIVWMRVKEAARLIWNENPKRHNIGDIMQSIQKRGFQELPKWDETLGGIKAGNGRVEALAEMEKEGYDLPRGLAIELDTDNWVMPILVGVDAPNRNEAIAYAIDSNNITLSAGDFSHIDMARLYDMDSYLALLGEVVGDGEPPITVEAEDLEALHHFHFGGDKSEDSSNADSSDSKGDGDGNSPSTGQSDHHDVDDDWPMIRAKVRPDLYRIYIKVTAEFGDGDDERIEGLLGQYKNAYGNQLGDDPYAD